MFETNDKDSAIMEPMNSAILMVIIKTNYKHWGEGTFQNNRE